MRTKDVLLRALLVTGIALLLIVDPPPAWGQAFYAVDGVALDGYDVVAYFTEGKPVKGNTTFAITIDSVQWRFSSEEHLKMFQDNKERYQPRFGGWCAYGVSENHKSPTSPDAWTIVNDKLYVNYNKKVKKIWLTDRDARIRAAEEYWTDLEHQD